MGRGVVVLVGPNVIHMTSTAGSWGKHPNNQCGRSSQNHAAAANRTTEAMPPSTTRFYSVAQVARMFGISSVTLYRAINAGEFPAVRVRGRLIVPARALDAMTELAVAQHTVIDAAGWEAQQ